MVGGPCSVSVMHAKPAGQLAFASHRMSIVTRTTSGPSPQAAISNPDSRLSRMACVIMDSSGGETKRATTTYR
ncbi:MAG: hypothetical protein E6J90_17370 [Deltaproteobacteria bacterium]|nr:MAG: hypothetical protein E6J90_17370 [Deltaproteobacteria bacterium]